MESYSAMKEENRPGAQASTTERLTREEGNTGLNTQTAEETQVATVKEDNKGLMQRNWRLTKPEEQNLNQYIMIDIFLTYSFITVFEM